MPHPNFVAILAALRPSSHSSKFLACLTRRLPGASFPIRFSSSDRSVLLNCTTYLRGGMVTPFSFLFIPYFTFFLPHLPRVALLVERDRVRCPSRSPEGEIVVDVPLVVRRGEHAVDAACEPARI